MLVDLSLLKSHCRVDYDSDDALLEHYLAAAIDTVVGATQDTVDNLTAKGGGALPTRLVQAVLLLAGHWYNQREDVSAVQMHSVPQGFDALVKPFRVFQ